MKKSFCFAACTVFVFSLAACFAAAQGVGEYPTGEFVRDINELFEVMVVEPHDSYRLNFGGDAHVTHAVGTRLPYERFGKLRFESLSVNQHLVHFSPSTERPGYYDLSLDITVDYDVLEAGPVYLESNNEASYWHLFNADTGHRGALYSRERMSIEETGPTKIDARVYSGHEHMAKGTNLVAGHHFYTIRDAYTDRYLGLCRPEGSFRRGWGIEGVPIQNPKHYPALLFTLADLTAFDLSFDNFKSAWEGGTLFTVELNVTDAAGETFSLPAGNVKARVSDGRRQEEIGLTPAFYDHYIPRGYFEGKIPEGMSPRTITLLGEVIYSGVEGETSIRRLRSAYRRGDNLVPAELIGKEGPRVFEKTRDGLVRETRLLYSHSGPLRTKDGIDEMLGRMAAANLNALVGQFHLSNGEVGWKSDYAPMWSGDDDFDSLAYTVEKAREYGIEVYAEFNFYTLPGQRNDWPEEWKSEQERLSDKFAAREDGEIQPRLCRINSAYRDYMSKMAAELAGNYEIHGIGLDLIRWGRGCFCDDCREDYAEKTGRDLVYDSENFTPYPEELTNWKEEGITAMVRAVNESAKSVNDSLKFVNAAFMWSSPDERNRTLQGQVTHLWLNEGILDFTIPMAYASTNWLAIIVQKDYLREAEDKAAIVPLFDLIDRWPHRTRRRTLFNKHPDLLASQIEEARRQGFKGVGFYWSGWLTDEIAAALGEGSFREQAVPAWVE